MSAVRIPQNVCEDQLLVVEPQINAEGIHVWPFDPAFPIDVRFITIGHGHNVRKNRHEYFELAYLCRGAASLEIQDRSLPLQHGDLAVVGSTLYHRFECRSNPPVTLAVLFFQPDLVRADGGPDNAEYLTPFLLQDPNFPHVVAAKASVPAQIFDLMQRIRTELPAGSPRARLAVKTYLKMILLLLVNQYACYAGTVDTFRRQQRALERLRPLFEHVEKHFGAATQVQEAARICGMSESHFMNFFKRATGQSFMAYLNHCRIERAQALLAMTDKPVSDISQEMGFCDQSYFGTVFRKLVGMTPAGYRAKSRRTAPRAREIMFRREPL
ncbi:MAG: helix-turn-helix transcriptional regulator [Acidobacteriaceae bacterium]|nr:helix-turn-helix transcriptional regulator [Acidobacteriaceae bacterium]MBV9499877.1 helix-turn-helix transcriptional regulator [Acidobacteriaceae bacterium]